MADQTTVPARATFHRGLLVAAGLAGLTGVLAGTFGTHGLKQTVTPEMLANFETGVRYHLIHAVALLSLVAFDALMPERKLFRVSAMLMASGIVVFSGSLYIMALSEQRWLGMITPIGGVCLLAGWASVVIAAWRWPRVYATTR